MTKQVPKHSITTSEPELSPVLARFCAAVDAINQWVGMVVGASVILVTAMVIYEVALRFFFGVSTTWSNEAVIYLSAMTYLLAGGYALLHHAHVRIDLLYATLTPRAQPWLDAATFVIFVLYAGTLTFIGGQMAWDSMLQHETTGSPWDPPIWPVKFSIMFAGILVLLQGVSNLICKFAEARTARL